LKGGNLIEIAVKRNRQEMNFTLSAEVEKKPLKIVSEDFAPLWEIIKTAIYLYAERR
jgi:hypothetical protein